MCKTLDSVTATLIVLVAILRGTIDAEERITVHLKAIVGIARALKIVYLEVCYPALVHSIHPHHQHSKLKLDKWGTCHLLQ